MLRNQLVFLSALTLASVCSAQQVYRVIDTAGDGGDGLAWGSAFDDLQAALGVVVAGDEIWVAEGLYTPSDTDAAASFVMIDGVNVYGGFAGDETLRSQRDPSTHVTRLSGDIGHDDTFVPTYLIHTANSGHIIDASGVSAGTVIDGLTLEYGAYGPAGGSAGNPLMSGAGIYCVGGSPTINNCVIQFCYSAFGAGGGMYFLNAHPTITNTKVQYNYGHLSNGAGIYLGGSSSAVIEDCEISYNTMIFSLPDGYGGGIAHDSDGELIVRRSLFEGNLVRPFYSLGDDVGYGGGIFSFRSPLTVEDSVFKSNTASIGGGIIA
ncbi:MAG: right-handed parallel beta-helix repeat-containing protein, partial [Phycisphaerales bacterium]|nr:right-handed parallel beta-helix repeat-containing protein [Phycisphaerales bacterium]